MATQLDALQLNITASTSGADRSLDNLARKLSALGNSIGAFNNSNFVGVSENIVSSLNTIKNVADNTNSASLKDISSGIRSLSNATKNLGDGSNISSYFTNLANGIERLTTTSQDFSSVTTLLKSINKLNSGSVTNAGTSLSNVATGLRNFSGISLPNLAGIEEFTANLRGLGSKTIVSASQSLAPIANALRMFQGINLTNIQGIAELARSISMFGRQTAQQAVTTIPQIAIAFRQLIATLATAPQVSSNVVQLTQALAQFVTNVNNVNRATPNASRGINLFGRVCHTTTGKTISLASAIGKLYATYFMLFRVFNMVKKSIDYASDLKEVQNVVDTTFGKMSDKVEEFAKTSINQFGLSELSAKQYASRFQAMGVAMGISSKRMSEAQQQLNAIHGDLGRRGYNDTADSMADMSLNLTKLTADMASFYNVAQSDVAKDLESVFTGSTRPLRQYGLDITNATLQEWAMKNGIDANIKSMSQAEKTLLRYQYVLANTSAAQGDFSKTSLTWANQIRILGQNFQRLGQVIGSGFIAWLRPMVVTINKYMDAIIAAVQKAVNALGKIFGWQMIVDTSGGVTDVAEGISDAFDDATGSAKKLKKELLGIDEINNLTTNDGGSGSGISGGGGAGGTNIIKPGGITFVPFESEIKDLYTLGSKISDALARLLPDDWTSIYQKAKNFGKGLADFLNGLIKPETFRKVGKTVGGALMTAIHAQLSFSQNADWAKWGKSIAEAINGFFEEFDGKTLAQSMNTFWQGVWTMLKETVKNIDWKEVWKDVKDFLGELDISTIGIIVGVLTIKKVLKWVIAGGAIKLLGSTIAGLIAGDSAFQGTITQAIGTRLGGALRGAGKTTAVKTGVGGMLGSIGAAWTSLGGLGGILTTDLATIVGAGTLAEIGVTIGTGIVLGIAAAIGGFRLGNWIGEQILGEDAPHATGREYAQCLWEGIKSGDFFVWFAEEIANAFKRGIEGVKDYFYDISHPFSVSTTHTTPSGEVHGGTSGKITDTGITVNKAPKGSKKKITIRGHANGGFPEQGSLFVAGETYGQTEWVGNINGRTGVTSGYEITGIAQAIRETAAQEISLLQMQNQYLSGILQKEFGISKKAIGEATRSYGKEFYNRTGLQPYNF